MSKFLLSDRVCYACNGFGVLPEISNSYRIRIYLDHDWIILSETYETLDQALQNVNLLKNGDPHVFYEIIKPMGELISV